MKNKKAPKILLTFITALALIVPMLTWTGTVSAQLTGAIFTTNIGCTGVNINLFPSKDDVYLDGGPAGGGSGLPDGFYYVRVTEPNGTLLGTSIGSGNNTPVQVVSGDFAVCYQLSAILIKASDATPGYDTTSNPGNEYKVWVSSVSSFTPSDSKTDNFKVFSDGGGGGTTTLSGLKFYDLNVNGQLDPATEGGIEGFKIEVYVDDVLFDTVFTDENGAWTVADVPVGVMIKVCEVLPAANLDGSFWLQTAPDLDPTEGDRCYRGTTGDAPITGLDFGNVCLRPGSGGFTLGFWSNKNGQKLIDASDLQCLRDLCLRKANGTNFDPTTNAQVKDWLLSANATNMAYMLSAQLTATKLSTRHGLSAGTIVLLTDSLADCFGSNTTTISNVMMLANNSLCANANTTTPHPARAQQECLKNILDAINNNQLLFVSPGPCAITYP